MKPQWQQFQQQQQRLQQQRMRQAGWQEQQKAKQAIKAQESEIKAAAEADARFAIVEQEAARLRKQFNAGKISLEALQARLQDLMVQDANGVWWMVGTESGRWYRYDGANWQPGTPPRGMPGLKSKVKPGRIPSAGGSRIKAFFIFIFGLAVSAGLFWAAGWMTYYGLEDTEFANPASFCVASVAALTGLVITWRQARKAARGY